jgi:hypothetical protein
MIASDKCRGCRDDFYNRGETRCWSAASGSMVKRYRIHYLAQPTMRGAFTKVVVPSCYHQANGYVFAKKLPDFVKPSDLNRARRA